MTELYILTHNCVEGGYTPVIFDTLAEGIDCMIKMAKETLEFAIKAKLTGGSQLTIDYADDTFDEYKLFKLQPCTLQVCNLDLSEIEYKQYGLDKFQDELLSYRTYQSNENLFR